MECIRSTVTSFIDNRIAKAGPAEFGFLQFLVLLRVLAVKTCLCMFVVDCLFAAFEWRVRRL